MELQGCLRATGVIAPGRPEPWVPAMNPVIRSKSWLKADPWGHPFEPQLPRREYDCKTLQLAASASSGAT